MMDYSRYEALDVTREGPILTVTMNRPPHNPVDAALDAELAEIFVDIGRDDAVSVVVLASSGKSFSAGGDLDWLIDTGVRGDHAGWLQSMRRGRRILMAMLDCDAPVIAKVNGAAIGLGATLALFADIAVAAETATFADPHVKIGLAAGDGGAIIWPRLVGHARARRMLLTGAPLNARTAADWGLISEAVPSDKLDDAVATLAREVAGFSRAAVTATKRALNAALLRDVVTAMDAHLGLETMTRLDRDHLEALQAVKERRPARFGGR